MDVALNTSLPQQSPPAPVMRADLRPTADAAAIARDPSPQIPLPIPASFAPLAQVNKARITQGIDEIVAQVDRTLKPYGITMLPYGPANLPPDAQQGR